MLVKAKKSLGQHFLVDQVIINNIAMQTGIAEQDVAIEIGPGNGALTLALPKCRALYCLELDENLAGRLTNKLPSYAKMVIGNAVKFDFMELLLKIQNQYQNPKIHIVGNLPYNVSSQIIINLLKQISHNPIAKQINMLFMLQKEMTARVVADNNSRSFGRFSVIAQAQADVSAGLIIKPEAFNPPPKVDSQLVMLKPKYDIGIDNFDDFSVFVRQSFQFKRKTLNNNLQKHYPKTLLQTVDFNLKQRAESVSAKQLMQLFLLLSGNQYENNK